MKRLSRNEVLALLAIAGVAGGTGGVSASDNTTSNISPMGVVEHPSMSRLGSDSACGKGSCGADDKGAAAAKKKHAEKKAEKKVEKKAEEKKSEKK